MPTLTSVDYILKAKLRWPVSAMALTHRLRTLNLLSDWAIKSTCIELTRRGYRTGEPGGSEHKVFAACFSRRCLRNSGRNERPKLMLPQCVAYPSRDEFEALIWGCSWSPA